MRTVVKLMIVALRLLTVTLTDLHGILHAIFMSKGWLSSIYLVPAVMLVHYHYLLTLGRRVTVVVLSLVNPRPEGYGTCSVIRSFVHSFCPSSCRDERSFLRAGKVMSMTSSTMACNLTRRFC